MAETKYIIRVARTDLNGKAPLYQALQKIKGVSNMMANAVCAVTQLDKNMKAGDMNEEHVKKLDDFFENPTNYNLPEWMFNRRKDRETGEVKHLVGAKLDFTQEGDIKRLRMIRSYRGIRHQFKLPLRGQRTRSNFRKNKGKAMGVKRKK